MISKNFHTPRLIQMILITVVLWSLLGIFSDFNSVINEVKHISFIRILAVLALSSVNYWIRVFRFNWLSRRAAERPIKSDINSLIFFSGLSMNLTPARIGEVVKAYYQRKFFGESFARMAPVVLIERLTDGLAMLGLMSLGVMSFGLGKKTFLILTIIALTIIFFLHQKNIQGRVLIAFKRVPVLNKLTGGLERAAGTSYKLTGFRPIIFSSLLGIAAWGIEAAGLWVLLGAVGVSLTFNNLYLALFIFAISAAAGFISVIPAGLGVNEISTIGLLEHFIGLRYASALVVTFAFRLVTLWFGILLGLASIVFLERKLER